MNSARVFRRAMENPAGLRFNEFQGLVVAFGFALKRTRGSHWMYERDGIFELINIQERSGKAKAYQVRQFLSLVERYNLTLEDQP